MVGSSGQHWNLTGIGIDAHFAHDPRHGWNCPGNIARSLRVEPQNSRCSTIIFPRAQII